MLGIIDVLNEEYTEDSASIEVVKKLCEDKILNQIRELRSEPDAIFTEHLAEMIKHKTYDEIRPLVEAYKLASLGYLEREDK